MFNTYPGTATPALWEPLDTGTAGTRSRPNR